MGKNILVTLSTILKADLSGLKPNVPIIFDGSKRPQTPFVSLLMSKYWLSLRVWWIFVPAIKSKALAGYLTIQLLAISYYSVS